ncbi:50S ribosomal protein L23 [Candidatus Microgenomates bacterium]|nr:50S ribosomal protein L23 [Candidatus Microgenomates bacterium]
MNVLIKPILTEKSTKIVENLNAFTFEVDWAANKHQISQTVEETFGVEVVKVRTIKLAGKTKRVRNRRNFQKLSDRVKAIVYLKKGQTIDLFPSEKKSKKTGRIKK